MNERVAAVFASAGLLVVVVIADIWMLRIGAWGPAIYVTVLAGVIVWLLIVEERHASASAPKPGTLDEERVYRRNSAYWV